jgi:hypothetical protein
VDVECLRARRAAMKIVFVHGRSQEGKDGRALEAEWLQAAIDGVAAAGLPPLPVLDAAHVVLPYYGDLLFRLTEQAGKDAFNTLVDRGAAASAPSAEEQAFTQAIVFAMAEKQGITPAQIAAEVNADVVEMNVQNWPAVLAALRLLNRIPQISQSVIELVTRDVWYYLTKKGVRLKIDQVVNAAIPADEPCIVVAHSLGTIVAYNLLMNQARANVKALITIGSPLGIEAIWSRLPSDKPPRRAPAGVPLWFNARDAQDTVALYEISPGTYNGDPKVSNYSGVSNTSDNHHGIVEYLHDPVIAKAICEAAM